MADGTSDPSDESSLQAGGAESTESGRDGSPPGERIIDLDIATELRQSYLKYAMSVIVDRALPDVRDGLKPSQRRILVAMNDLNLSPRHKTLKCAKVVGETMGNYHPHGDQAIYPTLVRLAQSFNMSETLILGQGNFGSIDGDPAASMRYTECRMTAAAVELLDDLDKETVDFRPNYDESRQEPTVLPGRFPNLLINGGAGIAVAMASSMPPHNPTEIANAIEAVLDNPDISIADLMVHVPGPDLPTGGRICGRGAILEAYRTGRAILEMRARCEVHETPKGAQEIIVTEIPYQVNKSTLLRKIADGVKNDRIQGVADIRDESSREVRIVIRLKRGEDPEIVLNQLYKYSQLRDSLSVIMIALIDGRPELCDLKRLMVEYIRHRKVVITRRTQYLLRKAEERHHLVSGLIKALDLIDAIVALIRASADPKEAKVGLMTSFGFSTAQAEAILQMRLQRLTGLQRQELERENEDLEQKIAGYKTILGDPRQVEAIIREDMATIRSRYPVARRTTIEDTQDDYSSLDLIAPENVVVTLSHEGYIKRTGLDEYRQQRRGGKGIKGAEHKEGDFVEHLLIANTHDLILCFTDKGKVYKEHVFGLPELGRYAKGRAAINFLNMGPDERICTILPLRDMSTDQSIVFVTAGGLVKRTKLSDFQNIHRGGILAISLVEGDSLIGTQLVDDTQEMVMITAKGMAIRFAAGDARAMGRTARGVRGIKLRKDDAVVGMAIVADDDTLLTVCERGYAKRSAFDDYRTQTRGGLGLRNLSRDGLVRNGNVVSARAVRDGDEVILITENGKTIRMEVTSEQFRVMGRATAGVRAIDVPDGDCLVSMASVRPEEGDEEHEGEDGEGLDAGAEIDAGDDLDARQEPDAADEQ
ncbi:MAG: DNA gyrase subunit A [Planctomycetota bacterium]|nr:DNA gyrase subunit A [Planctomycetota bacterium]